MNALLNVLPHAVGTNLRTDPGLHRARGIHYYKVLEQLNRRLSPEWYFEIGSWRGQSLEFVTCNFVAVDPKFRIDRSVISKAARFHLIQETSDDFFASDFLKANGIRPDLAFIDGMHLFEFALRDFMNTERNMAPGGTICFHDTLPFNASMATRNPSEMKKGLLHGGRMWTGDVWKLAAILSEYRPDLELFVLDAANTGMGIARNLDPKNTVLRDRYDEIVERFTKIDLKGYGPDKYYRDCNLTEVAAFLSSL